MSDELIAAVPVSRWLYTVVLSLGGTALFLAVASLLGLGRAIPRWSGLTLLIGAALALGWAALATLERGPIGFVALDAQAYAHDLRFVAMYVAGAAIGVAVAVALVLGAAQLRQGLRGRAALVASGLAPALGVVGLMVAMVLMVEMVENDGRHVHPPDTEFGRTVSADRLATAAFATDLVVSPAGEMFFAEHLSGRIRVLIPTVGGAFTAQTFAELPIPADGRLLHLALHPEWPRAPYLYATAHQGSGADQRLAVYRLHANGLEADLVETVIRGLPTEDPRRGPEADHLGSALAACGEFLYLSVGDTDSPGPSVPRPGRVQLRAQLPYMAEGKILRYRFDGPDLVPAAPNGSNPPVFAMGFRNVFAMDCGSDPERVIVADNGAEGRDQIREVVAGSNHEWPLSDERVQLTPPLYDSGPRSALAPTGVAVQTTATGVDIWFSAFHTAAIYRLLFDDESDAVNGVELVHVATGAILSMADGPDGCLYFTTPDGVWRLRSEGCGGAEGEVLPKPSESPAEMFVANCGPCHGRDGEGAVGPAINASALTNSDQFYVQRILNGSPGTSMPAWGKAGLTEQEAQALIDHLRTTR